jgi:predicted MPP superfamily phosphohydrolase
MSVKRWLIFFGVVGLVSATVHAYVWFRLIKQPRWSVRATWIGTIGVALAAICMPLGPVLARLLPRAWGSPITWLIYSWMGLLFIGFVIAVLSEIVRPFLAVWVRKHFPDLEQPARRVFLARGMAKSMAAVGLLVSIRGFWEGLRPTGIKTVQVRLKNWPKQLAGFRVVQLTDLHIGPMLGRDFLEHLVRSTNALKADVVAITGDMVDGSVEELGSTIAILQGIRARHGVYFVTGNHEYYSGASAWVDFVASLGIKVLRNERVRIEQNGGAVDIAGIDDWSAHEFGDGHKADLPGAMSGRDPEVPVVLLAHQPRAVLEAAKLGVDLQLSGHTHGGQIFPFNFLVYLQQPYVSGLHQHGDTQIYVSKGTGFWGPPMRLGLPSEIAQINVFPG